MFDSREYEWADLSAVLGGRDLTGIRGVTCGEKIELEALRAKGRRPHGIQRGNIDYEGQLIVLQSEYEALIKAGNGSLFGLKSLSLIVSFGNPSEGDPITTKQINGIYFSEGKIDTKQGDKFLEFTLPFLCTYFGPVV